MKELCKEVVKEPVRGIALKDLLELVEARRLRYAGDCCGVLVMPSLPAAAGKDGMIKHVMSGGNLSVVP